MNLKVLFVTSECRPFAATGGLADVSGSLPQALKAQGVDVRVVMPLYKTVLDHYEQELKFIDKTYIKLAWREQYCGVFSLKRNGITYYFIDHKFYFYRDGLYGHYDDGERFAYFSKAIFSLIDLVGFRPQIIHANDHQSALVPVYLDQYKRKAELLDIKSIFTIHNINYQSVYGMEILGDVFDLPAEYKEIVEYSGNINLMKAAIVCADLVTTVSPRYAREICTAKYARGLEYIVNSNRQKLVGILNGIDYAMYNPETDPNLYKNYDYETLVLGKKANKKAIQRALGLEVDDKACLIVSISRLSPLKGMDLVIDRFHEIMQKPVQFIILGVGESYYEHKFQEFARQYPGRVKAMIMFNDALSRQLYAAADLLLMPSQTEPCGISQMIASRYGTVPVVRATGGLYDTITAENGFTFKHFDSLLMLEAVNEAVDLFANRREFNKIMRNAFTKDFSWNKSALQYIEQFKKLLRSK